MAGFRIRNASNVKDLYVFVSKYSNSNGDDSWFAVADNYDDPSKSSWSRSGWELVAFQSSAAGARRGWYIQTNGQTVDLTFYGFEQDLGLVRH
ncbi:hypothetical protein CVT26_002282 [Gymnopilus dilepis]|uniref:Uncharacterized protein n=1 Tax=Gymnopilus dilepis TaxID=231916 RepID=A0A409YN14_9AGAR|nr:hypothetical protein CVT26_002282 [Gymnopilus dilepis]